VPMDAGYVNEISDPGSSEEVSVAYYRTAAARLASTHVVEFRVNPQCRAAA
jgi:hypothetical protein